MLKLITGNLQIIGYVVIALVMGGAAWKLYNTIKENGRYEMVIETQVKTIENKNLQIKGLEKEIEISNKFITLRDQEVKDLNTRLDGILENLGDDANDQAPLSLKEYFRRLEKEFK